MRSVAPESPGAAASQNSSLGVNLKPRAGRSTATTLQSCQTAKARNSDGTEIQRLMVAMALPCCCQNALSSGVQTARVLPRCLVTWVELAMAAPQFSYSQ